MCRCFIWLKASDEANACWKQILRYEGHLLFESSELLDIKLLLDNMEDRRSYLIRKESFSLKSCGSPTCTNKESIPRQFKACAKCKFHIFHHL